MTWLEVRRNVCLDGWEDSRRVVAAFPWQPLVGGVVDAWGRTGVMLGAYRADPVEADRRIIRASRACCLIPSRYAHEGHESKEM